MPHNHQCYTLGNHCAEFHPIPSVGRNQCKFPIPCKSPFILNIYRKWHENSYFHDFLWKYHFQLQSPLVKCSLPPSPHPHAPTPPPFSNWPPIYNCSKLWKQSVYFSNSKSSKQIWIRRSWLHRWYFTGSLHMNKQTKFTGFCQLLTFAFPSELAGRRWY